MNAPGVTSQRLWISKNFSRRAILSLTYGRPIRPVCCGSWAVERRYARFGARADCCRDPQTRKELGLTGTGGGVAIPHARIQGLNRSFGIFARLNKAIDFEAIDGRQVALVFPLLLPANPVGEQLKALAAERNHDVVTLLTIQKVSPMRSFAWCRSKLMRSNAPALPATAPQACTLQAADTKYPWPNVA
jgi:Phosphoenolpyruvate-dependent sugar phosphotransferase system, EIIA 2